MYSDEFMDGCKEINEIYKQIDYDNMKDDFKNACEEYRKKKERKEVHTFE